jgi:hypothetical protein
MTEIEQTSEEKEILQPFSEDDLANRFVVKHHPELRYVPEWNHIGIAFIKAAGGRKARCSPSTSPARFAAKPQAKAIIRMPGS